MKQEAESHLDLLIFIRLCDLERHGNPLYVLEPSSFKTFVFRMAAHPHEDIQLTALRARGHRLILAGTKITVHVLRTAPVHFISPPVPQKIFYLLYRYIYVENPVFSCLKQHNSHQQQAIA